MDDFINLLQEKGYSQYIGCCDCGSYYKSKTSMFVKQYHSTGFCICKKCARKLRNEIDEFLQEKESEN